ncbi:alpha-L-arabinofuranosidase [Pelagovum pacificum]|uniref:non-reducing end alpha-L-arabinofuranosidase n=1 Tax=Pelagovum pacificum TaxID=2588711 RepID=A0A5C5GH99_9RHOB|nr:alpha-L-arabinofuranosidase [Pelagovum pacificum]QQA42704.1 hypothetical protein I8N54_18335 [Pelagovum pacificum]TNY34145.1 alpha-L-arabinofuranosidase [Pelagovum pacificum]
MSSLKIDTTPKHEFSPRFYMQFMEPLGHTDSSVAACWNVLEDKWRDDFVEVVSDLKPSSIRWGGILTGFWKWREGVGDPKDRVPMVNYLWGGVETNRVGVHEFLDFCEMVGAEPIMGINFAGDGRPEYIETALGEKRAGTPEEAADLVSYCNDPDHAERKANGRDKPWNVRTWQIGNETSYPKAGERFDRHENAEQYVAFAKAMRERDPSITLIGWGDLERDTNESWTPTLLEAAGETIDMVAIHMMHQNPKDPDTPLRGRKYRDDYTKTWDALTEQYQSVESKLIGARETIEGINPKIRLAITEGHLSIQPHNKNEVLREWITGLFHARTLTLYERHSDILDIVTLADFAGQSWLVNAVLLGSPAEQPYLLPVGHVMRLFAHHVGTHGVEVESDDADLCVSATREGDKLFLHVANLDFEAEKTLSTGVTGKGTVHQIAPGKLDAYIDSTNLDVFAVETREVADASSVTLPPASVAAIVIDLS